jgi:hypothetical protein
VRTTYIEYVFDEATGLYRRREERVPPRCVAFARDEHVALLRSALQEPLITVTSVARLAEEASAPGAVAFVDVNLLDDLPGSGLPAAVVALVDDPPNETLQRAIVSLDAYPWLSNFVSIAMLSKPLARTHMAKLVARLALGDEPSMLSTGVGRAALLAQASKRDARFERVRAFFEKQGMSARTIATINDVFEELVTNALYDAPMESGYFKEAVPRTEDVDLPRERACEISYGVEDGTVYIRVRDTFGSLTRERLLAVLVRCNAANAQLDESRGGAGLGMWRVFSAATRISITVVPGHLTEVVVGIATGRGAAKQLLAVDLYFDPNASDSTVDVPNGSRDLLDHSVTLVRVA